MSYEVELYDRLDIAEYDPLERDLYVVKMWLHGRARNTQRAYEQAYRRFLSWVNKPLAEVTLADAQSFADSLALFDLAPATQATTLNAIRSLFKFCMEIGYVQVNVTKLLQVPKVEQKVPERILEVEEVRAIIGAARNKRDRAILLMLYFAALRVSELCQLQWRNLQQGKSGGVVTVFGKGGKTRTAGVPQKVYDEVMALKPEDAELSDPVFISDKYQQWNTTPNLKPRAIEYIVLDAASRAGVAKPVSPHWLRHSHASHALDAGAPIHLVQNTLGHANIGTTSIYLHARPDDSSGNYLTL